MIILVATISIPGCVIAEGNLGTSPGEQGYFSIHSTPASADVYFDGVFIGETPAMVPVASTGMQAHTIRITMPGYEPWVTTSGEHPHAGQTITVTATLVPAAGSGNILVTSSPTGAISTLDGSRAQTTPFTYTNVPAGIHDISVYLSGYQTFYGNVLVRGGETTEVFAGLSSTITSGALAAASDPAGAALHINGIYRGVTPTKGSHPPLDGHPLTRVFPGSHKAIRLRGQAVCRERHTRAAGAAECNSHHHAAAGTPAGWTHPSRNHWIARDCLYHQRPEAIVTHFSFLRVVTRKGRIGPGYQMVGRRCVSVS